MGTSVPKKTIITYREDFTSAPPPVICVVQQGRRERSGKSRMLRKTIRLDLVRSSPLIVRVGGFARLVL
jgi:hypothetical protein